MSIGGEVPVGLSPLFLSPPRSRGLVGVNAASTRHSLEPEDDPRWWSATRPAGAPIPRSSSRRSTDRFAGAERIRARAVNARPGDGCVDRSTGVVGREPWRTETTTMVTTTSQPIQNTFFTGASPPRRPGCPTARGVQERQVPVIRTRSRPRPHRVRSGRTRGPERWRRRRAARRRFRPRSRSRERSGSGMRPCRQGRSRSPWTGC